MFFNFSPEMIYIVGYRKKMHKHRILHSTCMRTETDEKGLLTTPWNGD